MQDWPTCSCWDTREAERNVHKFVPGWVLGILTAAALALLIACFATGVCEIAAIIAGLGTAVVLLLIGILEAMGFKDSTTLAQSGAPKKPTQTGKGDATKKKA